MFSAKRKKSLFSRLTNNISLQEDAHDDEYLDEEYEEPDSTSEDDSWEEEEEGQLAIDMYQTADSIVIKAMIAGVKHNDLDISITRELVTIRGERHERRTIDDSNYFNQELYWGTFSRTIVLPAEVEIEEADAVEDQGLLMITLPKIDKDRQARLKVRAS